ncbi:MAG: rRNA maturation RNAse YbeY [Kiritimatiellae bacterium]|nr:rRNA maturation RNAse YbeY [Kiritimatiellia bacterium]
MRNLKRLILNLAGRINRDAGRSPWRELTVLFTDDEGIVPVNIACFGKAWPTDVITQPYASPPGGEVIVNVERALAVGGPGPRGEAELALYIAHGLHHLAGAVDHTPAQRRAMLRQERAWLRAAGRAGLLDNLWRAAGPGRR